MTELPSATYCGRSWCMDPETTPSLARPPGAVIAMSIVWSSGAFFELVLWFINREIFFLVVRAVAAVLAVTILKGYRWVFWANLAMLSLALGISWLQIQVPSWASGTPQPIVWGRAGVTLGFIALHQLRSVRHWFGIRSTGKRWHASFWLLAGGLAVLGQFILPALRQL